MFRLIFWIYSLFTKKQFIFITSDDYTVNTLSNIEDDEPFYELIARVYCTVSDKPQEVLPEDNNDTD